MINIFSILNFRNSISYSTHLHATGVRTVRQNVLLQLVINLLKAFGMDLMDVTSSALFLVIFVIDDVFEG